MPGTRKLGRTTAHRNAMLRGMVTLLLENGQVETTLTRAKEVRSIAEKMITLGKKDTLASRRAALAYITKGEVVKKVFIEGLDNTLTNMRIAAIQTGVLLYSGGNFLRNIHPLGGVKQDEPEYYANSCAFRETTRGGNFYDSCYSDNFAVGFESAPNAKCVYNDCFCYWYSPLGDSQVGFRAKGKFNSMIKNAKVAFNGKSEPQFNAFLQVEEQGGQGVVMFPMTPDERMGDKTYKDYLFGTVI